MASRILQPLRLGRPLLPCGLLCRGSAPERPSPAQLRVQGAGVRSSPLPEPTRAPGRRAFSRAGPAYRSKTNWYRKKTTGNHSQERRQIDKRKVVLSCKQPPVGSISARQSRGTLGRPCHHVE